MEHVRELAVADAAGILRGPARPEPAARAVKELPQIRHHLAGVLQVTLDLECLLELFAAEIRKLVPVDRVGYLHERMGIEVFEGPAARHQARYRLDLEGEYLGEMVFSRARRFTQEELAVFEETLFGAVYPIRNALLYRQAMQEAMQDPLTGLFNRAALDRTLEQEVARAQRYGMRLSLLVVDVDHFKAVNDHLGHQAGDQVLKALAALLRRLKRKSDLVFRYGGDEFVIVLPNTGLSGAMVLAKRIHAAVNSDDALPLPGNLRPTFSIGAAALREGETSRELFERADGALYRAKEGGRNGYCVEDRTATLYGS